MKKRFFTFLLCLTFLIIAPTQYVQAEQSIQDQESVIEANIPESYREFITEGSSFYHSFIPATNFDIPDGEIRNINRTLSDGRILEAYYISAGSKRIQLVSPDGTIMTAEILEQYFNGIAPVQEGGILDIEMEIIRLVNEERQKAGITPLQINTQLMDIASIKAEEMAELRYASHESPVYGSPSNFAKHYGYDKSVAENIRGGFLQEVTAEAMVNAWMSSDGHRANILNPKHKYTGVGWSSFVVTNESGTHSATSYRFVQLFSY